MRYKKIILNNHRVFFGTQTLSIPDGQGVVVLHGKNGKGKTSFLNAIRWAWTDVCKARGGRRVTGRRLLNSQAVAEAAELRPVEGSVTLIFEDDAHEWELKRSITLTGESLHGDVTLLRDGVALSASDASQRLSEFMPGPIEQFFLFDGELLDQYEALVDDESVVGSPLRDAIEQVLGVPLVINAAKDVRALAEEAGKAIAAAAKRERSTQQLGIALEQAQDVAKQHRENRESEDERISKLETDLREVEEELAEQTNKLTLLGKRDAAREQRDALRASRDEARAELAASLGVSWRALLVDPLKVAVFKLEESLETDRVALAEQTVAIQLLAKQSELGPDVCPACASRLDAEHAAHLSEMLRNADPQEFDALTRGVQARAERLRTLRGIVDEGARSTLKVLEASSRRLDLELEDSKDDLEQLEDQLKDVPTGSLQTLVKNRTEIALRLEQARKLRAEADDAYRTTSGAVDSLRKQIAAQRPRTSDPATEQREKLTKDLADLFDKAIIAYRERLKVDVQDAATRLFTKMRTETDFVKLLINDQYGLRILNRSGEIVEDRSAGYEHLVALSLIGALQQCSPITGPVVMDTPFGRLDPDHVLGVLGQLNTLADQVFVLVHAGELNSETARTHLRNRLLAEFDLERVSSTNTQIKELRA